jgi:hypothetical protein
MPRCRFVPCAALLTLLALTPHAALAQRPILDSLSVGARVRATAPRAGRVTGAVLGYRADTLLLLRTRRRAPEPDTVALALGALSALEVSLGRQSRHRETVGRGAVVGALVGAGGGLMAIAGEGSNADGFRAPMMALSTTAGMAAGALVGALVGAAPVERWQPIRHRARAAPRRVATPAGRAGAAPPR